MNTKKNIHHCDRCGELFKSEQKAAKDIVCTHCGLHPVKVGFASMEHMPTINPEDLDENHGVAGRDAADFMTMQKVKKKRQAVAVFTPWCLLLGVAGFIGWMIQNDRTERKEKNRVVDHDKNEHDEVLNDAYRKCQITMTGSKIMDKRGNLVVDEIGFLNAANPIKKLEYIVGGDDYASALPLYYDNTNSMVKFRYGKARIRNIEVKKVDGFWRCRAIFEQTREVKEEDTDVITKSKETFEAVFWKVGDKWLLDWPQFVRLYETKWQNFIRNKDQKRSYRFRIYVRSRSVALSGNHKYDEFVMYPARNQVGKPSGDPVPVYVPKTKNIRGLLLKHVNRTKERDAENLSIIEYIDPVNLARVDVGLTFAEIDGEIVPVIDKLYGVDWTTAPKGAKPEAKK